MKVRRRIKMARMTLDELIAKNTLEIEQQETVVKQAQSKLKKLKEKRKDLQQRKCDEDRQNMLNLLNSLNINNPDELQQVLDKYQNEFAQKNSEPVESGTGSAFTNSENQGINQ